MHLLFDEHEVILDAVDLSLLCGHSVTIYPNGRTSYVAVDGQYLHRLIVGAKKGQVVDHINSNGLDNRRENLRFCTPGQNRQRAAVSRQVSASGYRGVSRHRHGWKAAIWADGRYLYIGHFSDQISAAVAYDSCAVRLFGQYAKTNF